MGTPGGQACASVATCPVQWWNEQKGGDPSTGHPTKGTTRTPGWHPEEKEAQLPLVSEKRYSQISVGCVSAQWSLRTPVRQREGTQGPWRRCYGLLRRLLVRCGWTVACVGTFVSLLALLDKTAENISTRSSPAQNVGQPHASEDETVCRMSCRWQHGRVGTTGIFASSTCYNE